MRLVLSEKPSVAVDLARVMDPGARRSQGCIEGRFATWTWALGHLVELLPPEAYRPELQGRWRLELLPVLPERFGLRPRAERSDHLEVVRGLLARAQEVVVATDAGREGELIWEYIAEVCGWRGPTRRLWLSEGTPAAIRAAFAGLRAPMTHLAQAARARAQADWVVGMNATMALSARHGGLWSAGRVQTPTLALLCAREAEIRAFRPEDFFVVLAEFEADQGARYGGRWFKDRADRLRSRAEAERVVAAVRGGRGRVLSVERKRTEEAPPRLFNLTDLQRAANARYGLTAAATLEAAQSLYERHKLLTYPRTDSRHVSAETFATFPQRLRAIQGSLAGAAARLAADLPHPGKRVVDDAGVSDHHALLPTAHPADPARLGAAEAQVYELVLRRFLAALLPPAGYDEAEAVTEVAGETFRSRTRQLVVPGWREVEPPAAAEPPGTRPRARKAASGEPAQTEGDGQDAAESAGDLSGLEAGMACRCRTAKVEARQTKAPPRYSEATLLRAMEHAGRLVLDEELAAAMRERGLGTPATRAAIIETLVKREYVQRDKRSLLPTPRGERLVELAPPELRQPETTGEWERRLREIEAGRAEAEPFLGGLADLTRRIVADVAAQARAAPVPAARDVLGVCPRCGGSVVEGRTGFGCANWRPEAGGCRFIVWKRLAGKALTTTQARELLTLGQTRRVVKGFVSRSGEKFEARLRLERESGRVSFVAAARAATKDTPAPVRARGAAAGAAAGRGVAEGAPARRATASVAGAPAGGGVADGASARGGVAARGAGAAARRGAAQWEGAARPRTAPPPAGEAVPARAPHPPLRGR